MGSLGKGLIEGAEGIRHFVPSNGVTGLDPVMLINLQIQALDWLGTDDAEKFSCMIQQIQNGPLDCVFGDKNNRVGEISKYVVDFDFCKTHFLWSETDVQIYHKGIQALQILHQTDAYEAIKSLMEGTSDMIQSYVDNLNKIEQQRKQLIYNKWKGIGKRFRERVLGIFN